MRVGWVRHMGNGECMLCEMRSYRYDNMWCMWKLRRPHSSSLMIRKFIILYISHTNISVGKIFVSWHYFVQLFPLYSLINIILCLFSVFISNIINDFRMAATDFPPICPIKAIFISLPFCPYCFSLLPICN